jgi:hypothetical protein
MRTSISYGEHGDEAFDRIGEWERGAGSWFFNWDNRKSHETSWDPSLGQLGSEFAKGHCEGCVLFCDIM